MRPYGILLGVDGEYHTDVSGQPIGPIFKGQVVFAFLDYLMLEDGTDRLSRSVGMELPIPIRVQIRLRHQISMIVTTLTITNGHLPCRLSAIQM
jgi:hypothetical protein